MEISNHKGLTISFLENGNIKSINAGPVRISMKEANLFTRSGMNIYLRKLNDPIRFSPLLEPGSNGRFRIDGNKFITVGHWEELDFKCILQLSEEIAAWQCTIEIKNSSKEIQHLDLVYGQDISLKTLSSGLVNEFYVSQYIERLILEDNRYGKVVCCRQNMKESGGHPWLMLACRNGAVSACTDGMQFYGRSFRETGIPEGLLQNKLGGEYAGESSFAELQEKPFTLAPGEKHSSEFIGYFLPDHPAATSAEDLKLLPEVFESFRTTEQISSSPEPNLPESSLFNTSDFLQAEDLSDEELVRYFGQERRHEERINGELLSFFYGDHYHVVLRSKEILADRPHGHIMQAKTSLTPNDQIMSTTAFAFGVFNSHITQGNTNFNTLLSVCTSQFNQSPETGQRIFIEIAGKYYLLAVPSAFEMGFNHCRWIYKFGEHCLQIRTWTSRKLPQVYMDVSVLEGNPLKMVITHDFDPLNGWKISTVSQNNEFLATPAADSMIASKFPQARFRIRVEKAASFSAGNAELLFADRQHHEQNFFVIKTDSVKEFCMSFVGEVAEPCQIQEVIDPDVQFQADCLDNQNEWKNLFRNLNLESTHKDIQAIREILPWFGVNALTHYLTPYGLEQFSGAAWGTRDVSQGPVDLLLNLGKYAEARKVLCIIFSNQNPDGGWPQWWMFDVYRNIRAHEAHGDIFYWCIMALSHYIRVTGDFGILDEALPYYHEKTDDSAEITPLSEHLDRLINMITASFIPGTALVPFGGGDWNDSLQPVSHELAERLISSWTVEMNYQAFTEYMEVCERAGFTNKAHELQVICDRIKSDFNKYLIRDGIVAGYGLVESDGSIGVLLHPSDRTTGIHYSILPMNRGIISGTFNAEQAKHHQQLIEQHLKGPDGARLMNRPLKYKGGIQTIFQRAESSTFFGREIGLMYMHEHIRYAEALSMTGKAEEFIVALRQAIPVAYRDIVPCSDIRQANCYYSSSDVAFKNRYDADERYDEVINGKLMVRGGWRVYSSGPGIYIALIISRLLGLRIEHGNVIFDPVMPLSFDGLKVSLEFLEKNIQLQFSVKQRTHNPMAIRINNMPVSFSYKENPYRTGGAVIQKAKFIELLTEHENIIAIDL